MDRQQHITGDVRIEGNSVVIDLRVGNKLAANITVPSAGDDEVILDAIKLACKGLENRLYEEFEWKCK